MRRIQQAPRPGPILAACLAACLCCLVSVRVSAGGGGPGDGPEPGGEPAFPLEDLVVTATRQERGLADVPSAAGAIAGRDLRERTASVLPDLLRGEAGVFVQQTTPGQGSPILRGLIGSSVLMLVDGMRLNTAFFRPAPNQYFALVDPFLVDRLEWVRGSESTLYGSDAMGGVVQAITPTPRFQGERWQARGLVRARFASADTAWGTRAVVEAGRRGAAARAGFTYQAHDDLRGGRGTGVQRPSAYDVWASDGAVFFERERHDFLVSVQYLRQPETPRYDEMTPGFGQDRPASAEFFFEPNDRLFVHGRYRCRRPIGFVDRLELHAAFQQIDDDRRTRDFGSAVRQRERNRSGLTGVTLQLTSRWRDRMVFTYGGEVYLDRIRSARTDHDLATGEVTPATSRFADGSTMDAVGLYLQDEVRVVRRLALVLGARLSHFHVKVPEADRGVGADLSFPDVTGSLGLLYRLAETVSLAANAGRGFRAPNVFDLSTLGPRPGNRYSVPNPDLEPEQVISVDAGVKCRTARLACEVFGFYSRFTDKITDIPTGLLTPDGRLVVRSENLSRVTLAGVEAGGRFQLVEALDLFGAFTYTWGEEESPDGGVEPASRIPPANGRVGLRWRPLATVRVEPWVRFAAPQDRLSERDRRDPRIDPDGTPGWATLNVRIGWEAHERVRAELAMENLLDSAYREHGSGIDAPGINAVLSVEARF